MPPVFVSRRLPIDFQASDLALKAWSFPPTELDTGAAITNGTMYLVKVILRQQALITNLHAIITTGATTPVAGQCFAAIYDTTGALRGQTADISGSLATNLRTWPLTAPVTLPAGEYWVAFFFNAAAGPNLARGSQQSITAQNGLLAAGNERFAVNGTGLTTTVPSSITPASNTTGSGATTYFAAVS